MVRDRDSRNRFSLIANALADPRRYAILKQIANQGTPVCYSALRTEHDIGAPTVSHHIKLLAEAKLIDVKRQGTRTQMMFRPEILERYLRDIEQELKLA